VDAGNEAFLGCDNGGEGAFFTDSFAGKGLVALTCVLAFFLGGIVQMDCPSYQAESKVFLLGLTPFSIRSVCRWHLRALSRLAGYDKEGADERRMWQAVRAKDRRARGKANRGIEGLAVGRWSVVVKM
jgi:hypothetical protein